MNRIFLFRLAAALVGFAAVGSAPLAAQEIVAPPAPNADRLAEEMRSLARDPRDVRALLSAGELSARLNDPSAAAGFFARAQALAPGNPRVMAGQAMVMVRMERPGEALRLFALAARGGLAMDNYASDRGLAYDLVGAQGHAQRDHRVAMRGNPDDETIRRFALSLGISGKVDEAMRVLDPLLRRTDRAAWRARAFILAMNGDAAGADKIAASMMGGFGTALSPFFRRLPTLPAADKAFAVHFGEMRRTPARIADASVAPPLPYLAPDPVAVASAPSARPQQSARATELSGSDRRRQEREERQAARRAAREAAAKRGADARTAQQQAVQRAAEQRAAAERAALATRQRETERVAAAQRAAQEAEARRVAEAGRQAEAARLAEAQRLAAATPPPVIPLSVAPPPTPSAQTATVTPIPVVPQPPVQQPIVPAQLAQAPVSPQESPPSQTPLPAPESGSRVGSEDNVIARIVAGITIPASELDVPPMPGRADPAPAAVAPPVAVAQADPPPRASPVIEKPKVEPVRKPADAKPVTTKTAAGKAAAGKAKQPDPAKAEPARHWAQVAGGADIGALPREWKRLIERAPAEFRGKQAWTTPLRFTNRLLTGPFKTPDEAQAFINAIAKKGLSGFAWSSEAGQKIAKLAVK